jgi:hypothetical protein
VGRKGRLVRLLHRWRRLGSNPVLLPKPSGIAPDPAQSTVSSDGPRRLQREENQDSPPASRACLLSGRFRFDSRRGHSQKGPAIWAISLFLDARLMGGNVTEPGFGPLLPFAAQKNGSTATPLARPGTPTTRSCRRRPPPATPAPGRDHCARSLPAHPTPRTRHAAQAAASPKQQSSPCAQRRGQARARAPVTRHPGGPTGVSTGRDAHAQRSRFIARRKHEDRLGLPEPPSGDRYERH